MQTMLKSSSLTQLNYSIKEYLNFLASKERMS